MEEEEEEEEEGRKVLCSLRGSLTRAKREMECAYPPTARPADGGTDGRTTKGASRARGNDILLRARPSSVRPSVRPSAVRWGHPQLDGWKWEPALLNASRLASPPQLAAATLNCRHLAYSGERALR